MGLAFVPVYIRCLGVEAYGIVGLFVLIQAWLPLLDMGMTPMLNREMARFTAGAHNVKSIRELLRSIEIICFCLATAIALGIWGSSGFIATGWLKAQHIPAGVIADAIAIMAFVVALRFCEGIYRGALLGLQKQVAYNVATGVIATVRHAGAAAVVTWVSPTIRAFFAWQAAVSMLSIGALAYLVYSATPPAYASVRFSWGSVSACWRFAGGSAAITFLALLLTQVDKILLSRILPLETFGFFMLAVTICTVLSMVFGPICNAIYPRMVAAVTAGTTEALSRMYHRTAQLLTALVVPVGLTISFFSFDILAAWSGKTSLATATAPILSIYVLGSMFNAIVTLPVYLQLAYGWTRLTVYTNLIAVALLMPVIVVTVPRYGITAAAVIWTVLNFGYLSIMVRFMHRRILRKEAGRWMWQDVIVPGMVAFVVVALGWLIVNRFLPNNPILRIPGILSVFCLATGSSLYTTEIGRDLLRRCFERCRFEPGFTPEARDIDSSREAKRSPPDSAQGLRLVTIAIPTFNRPQLLARALECAVSQDYSRLEILISDNASFDPETSSLVSRYMSVDRRIKYWRQDTNRGVMWNLFFLLRQAHGEYFMWLADDDAISKAYVSALTGVLESDPTAACAFCPYRQITSSGVVRHRRRGFMSRSIFRRIFFYVFRPDDGFFYGLHRTELLRGIRLRDWWWPNREIISYWAYPYLLEVVLAGRVVLIDDRRAEWTNDLRTAKHYPMAKSLFGVAQFILLRVNFYCEFVRRAIAQSEFSVAAWLALLMVPALICDYALFFARLTSTVIRRLIISQFTSKTPT
jgi:O-antigen/teichoic acid export membrane protein/glycosyltransferase involved in cell wall biosynthesis